MKHEKGQWYTKEMADYSADQYNNYKEWRKHDLSACTAAIRNGWIESIIDRKNWKPYVAPKVRLNEIAVAEDAKKYSTLKDWQMQSPSTYHWAWRHGMIDRLSKHIKRQTKKKKKKKTFIYYKGVL